jgi:hypothetical protein
MAAGSIIVDLLMRTGSFETDTKRAEKALSKFKKEAMETAKQVGAVMGGAAVVAGGALVALTKQAIDSADGINKLSQKTGESAETLSALQYAFELGDVSGEEFSSSLTKLSRSMSEAAQGSGDAAKAFDLMKVSVKNADGSLRPVGDVLGDVAEKFAGYKDGAEKTALAQAIFGKSGADLIPVLNAGRDGLKSMADEAQRLGIVISSETARAAEEFNDTLTKIGKGADAAGQQMAVRILPSMQVVADELLRINQEGSVAAETLELLGSVADFGIKALALTASAVVYLFKEVGRYIGGTVAAISALATLDIKGFRAISDAVREDSERARAELVAFERRILSVGSLPQAADDGRRSASNDPRSLTFGKPPPLPAAPRIPGAPSGGKGAGSASARSFTDYQTELAQSVGRAIEGSDIIKARELADQIAYLDKLLAAGLDVDIYVSTLKKLKGETEDADGALQEYTAHQQMLADLLGQTVSAKLEKQRFQLQSITKEYEAGKYGAVGSAEAAQKYGEVVDVVLGRQGEQVTQAKTAAEELGMTFSSAFEDAIVGGKGLRDVLKGLEQDILRIVTRKLVTEPLGEFFSNLFKPSGGGGGGGFDFLTTALQFITGSRAIGGPVGAGGLYEVNERGRPEMLQMDGREFLLMGNRRGWVDPADSRGTRGGSNWAPVFHMTFAPGTTAATATQAGAMVARRIQAAAQRNS